MDLNEVSVFIKVVQAGSFSGAAQQLGMPKSTVSSKVSSLEKRLGVTLIQRTTRKLNVTGAGLAYFKRCVRGLEEIKGGEIEIASFQDEPQGLLRLTAPIGFGGSNLLPQLVSQFKVKYPKVTIEMILTDRVVDLLEEGIDLAIRGGDLEDSTLIAKKLGEHYFAPFASPHYLKMRGHPKHPRDLRDHECIQFTQLDVGEWILKNAKSSVKVPIVSALMSNELNLIKQLTLFGNGIALLPVFLCYAEVKARKLVRILPEWNSGLSPIHFVYPAQRFVTPKLSAFISFAAEPLKLSLESFEI